VLGIRRLGNGVLALGVTVLAAGGWALYRAESAVPPTRVLTVGFQNSPPYHFPDSNGHATGPTVDSLAMAAEQLHIKLQWVFSPEGPERALSSGAVDLWPLVGDLPERKTLLYVTAPLAQMTYTVLFPESRPVKREADLAGRRLATTRISSDLRIAAEHFKAADRPSFAATDEVIAAVCTGSADAGLLTVNAFLSIRLPNCPTGELRLMPLKNASFWFGVGATRKRSDAMRAADLLRDQIGKLAADGTLTSVDFRWNTKLTQEVNTIFAYRQARVYTFVLLGLFTVLLPTLGIMILLSRRLRVAERDAVAASHAKSAFLAAMSHEIRTPLNGVIGMTGLLLDSPLSTEQREFAETARRSGEALLCVINDILDFSKIEAGRMMIESTPFDLRTVLEEVNEMVAQKAEERKLDLVLQYPAAAPRHFMGDAARIRQVVTNLVGNAVKFTHEGHVLVSLDWNPRHDGAIQIKVIVEDTGVGIPADKIGMLFEKFTQVDDATTRKYGGTGLGLAISKQLVTMMGGEIGVESRERVGSKFWFTLPLAVDTAPPPAPADVGDLAGLRVLIVDDNDVNRRVLHEQILSWQMRNGSFASGEQAISAMEAAVEAGDPYHFVLLDFQMPSMDGATVAETIRANPKFQHTVVLMLTSVGHMGEVRSLAGAQVDACLVKPVRQSLLLNTMTNAWARKARDAGGLAEPPATTATRAAVFAGSKARVLVAEDNVVNQKVAAKMLERLGLHADVAGNGLEAVEMFGNGAYDLVFMDCHMPEMDGYTATQEIRRRYESAPRIPIIAMTAEVMEGCREQCFACGMDDYVAKPVKLDELKSALVKWLPVGAR